jgi:rRNA processing protein Gar1
MLVTNNIKVGDKMYFKTSRNIGTIKNIEIGEWESPHGSCSIIEYIKNFEVDIDGKIFNINPDDRDIMFKKDLEYEISKLEKYKKILEKM